MKLSPSEVRDIAAVLDAWSSLDDWNVKGIYINMARELIADLAAGDDPVTLIRAAKTCGNTSPVDALHIPHHVERERREDAARKARRS